MTPGEALGAVVVWSSPGGGGNGDGVGEAWFTPWSRA